MMFFIVVGWILLSGVSVEASDITVSKHVGEYVMITCSHSFAEGNVKYFCRDPCKEQEHVLIKSNKSVKSPSGKYRLEDTGKGVFMVTITDLQKSDTGTYYCGVERYLKDTFTTVILTVKDATPPPTNRKNPPTATPAPAPARTSRSEEPSISSTTATILTSTPPTDSPSMSKPTSSISSTHAQTTGGLTTVLLYVAAVLVSTVIIFGLSLVTLFKRKRRTTESQSPVSSNTIYSEVKKPKKSSNIPTSLTERSDEDTLENPLYGSLELEMETVYSQIYTISH